MTLHLQDCKNLAEKSSRLIHIYFKMYFLGLGLLLSGRDLPSICEGPGFNIQYGQKKSTLLI
jgi:hypothetical protein